MKFEASVTSEILLKAGYKKQTNGFVRNMADGRFHAFIGKVIKPPHEYKKVVDIHFDFFFRKDAHPSVFYTPELLSNEVKRIKGFI